MLCEFCKKFLTKLNKKFPTSISGGMNRFFVDKGEVKVIIKLRGGGIMMNEMNEMNEGKRTDFV